MEDGADKWIVDCFKPYFDKIEFFSWLREPDFCDNYRERWEKDKELSVNTTPRRFELASFWRIVHLEQRRSLIRSKSGFEKNSQARY
jgi:hypothetical protein